MPSRGEVFGQVYAVGPGQQGQQYQQQHAYMPVGGAVARRGDEASSSLPQAELIADGMAVAGGHFYAEGEGGRGGGTQAPYSYTLVQPSAPPLG